MREHPWLPEKRRYKMAGDKISERMPTERRTPTPANITFAGENTCQINMRQMLDYFHGPRYTRLTLSPSVSEKAYRTFTVGSSHLDHRSLLLWDRSSPCTCNWRTARTALGESQAWSCTASGWARRSFFVRFSYSFKALLNIS